MLLNTMPTLTRSQCEAMIQTDPRFTEEPIYVPYYWAQAVDGWADREGRGPYGRFYEFYPSDEDLESFPELTPIKGRTIRIVHSPIDGTVTAYLKPAK